MFFQHLSHQGTAMPTGWEFLGSPAMQSSPTRVRSVLGPLPPSRCTPLTTALRTIEVRSTTRSTMIILVTPSQPTPRAQTRRTHVPRSPQGRARMAPLQGQEGKPTMVMPTTTTCPRATSGQAAEATLQLGQSP